MTSANWKPAIQIWRWEDAPEEFRAIVGPQPEPEEGRDSHPWESVVYLPASLIDESGWFFGHSVVLSFLNDFPKYGQDSMAYAGDGWGWFMLKQLSDGGRVAFTTESVRPH